MFPNLLSTSSIFFIMKKQLSKSEIEVRKEKRGKLFRNLFIVSSILNVLFITLCIFACSSTKKEVSGRVDQEPLSQVRNKNLINEGVKSTNSIGFPLDDSTKMIKPNLIGRPVIKDYIVSLGSTMAIVVRDSNDTTIALDEQWHIYFNLHYPLVDSTDYIRIETPNWTRVYYPDSEVDIWDIALISPENYTYNDIYLPVSLGYSSTNYDLFKNDLLEFFVSSPYTDWTLSSSWRPYNYIPTIDWMVAFDSSLQNNDPLEALRVSNSIFGNSYYILKDTIFSVNGSLYTDLLFHAQRLTDPQFLVYQYNYSNPASFVTPPGVYSFIDFVYAYNRSSNRYITLWSIPYEDVNNTIHAYLFESGFRSPEFQKIRLFDRHSQLNTLPGYNNGNVLSVNGSIVGGNSPSTGAIVQNPIEGVFDLFTTAFTGLAGLFSIALIPGITIGMLLFLPLVAIIVFAIIKIIHK